jgi:hypothetical protein
MLAMVNPLQDCELFFGQTITSFPTFYYTGAGGKSTRRHSMLAFSIFIAGILFLMAMSLSEDTWTGGA